MIVCSRERKTCPCLPPWPKHTAVSSMFTRSVFFPGPHSEATKSNHFHAALACAQKATQHTNVRACASAQSAGRLSCQVKMSTLKFCENQTLAEGVADASTSNSEMSLSGRSRGHCVKSERDTNQQMQWCDHGCLRAAAQPAFGSHANGFNFKF